MTPALRAVAGVTAGIVKPEVVPAGVVVVREALRIFGGLDGFGHSLLIRILGPPLLNFAFPFRTLLRAVTFVLVFFIAPDSFPVLGLSPDT